MLRSGSMSFRARYGETGHHLAGPLGRRLSLWSMGLRLFSPQNSPWAPYVSRHTTKPCRTSSDARISTSSMKEDDNLLLKMHGITKHSNATKSSSCTAESSRWMIWCSNGCSLKKELTSSPRLGGPLPRDRSMPPWMCPPGYGGWRTTAQPIEHRAPP
jgi:hypothetical protein